MVMAQSIFLHNLITLKLDLIMYDFIELWFPIIYASLNIHCVLFLTPGALTGSYFSQIFKKKLVSGYQFPFIYKLSTRKIDMFEPTERTKLTTEYTFR